MLNQIFLSDVPARAVFILEFRTPIEGLLKLAVDYSFWDKLTRNIPEDKLDLSFVTPVNALVEKQTLFQTIDFLEKTKLIDQNQKQKLHQYREKRNKVLHDLVKQISKENFEQELKEACELGDSIIETEKFKETSNLLINLEKLRSGEGKIQ